MDDFEVSVGPFALTLLRDGLFLRGRQGERHWHWDDVRGWFVDGVEIIEVPRFRVDTGAWNAFVESFARQLHLESIKRRSVSLIYQRVSAALTGLAEDPFEDPRRTIKLLRKHWNDVIEDDEGEATTVGAYVDGYQDTGR